MARSKVRCVSASFIGRVAYYPHAAYLSTQGEAINKLSQKNITRGDRAHTNYNARHTGIELDKHWLMRLGAGET